MDLFDIHIAIAIAMQSDKMHRQQSSPPAFIYVWIGIGWAIKREQKLMLFKFFFSTFSIHIGWIFLIPFDLYSSQFTAFPPRSLSLSHLLSDAHLKILFIICLSFTVDSNMQMQWQSKVGWISTFIIQKLSARFPFQIHSPLLYSFTLGLF